jgi:heterodisulfide reductase subunit A
MVIRNALELAGINKYLFEMVNLRDQCAWVTPDKEDATVKAKSLMIAGSGMSMCRCREERYPILLSRRY